MFEETYVPWLSPGCFGLVWLSVLKCVIHTIILSNFRIIKSLDSLINYATLEYMLHSGRKLKTIQL